MLPSRQQIDRLSTTGRDLFGWLIFGLALFLVVAHTLNSQWEDSLKCLALAVTICPLVPIAFEVRASIAMAILLVGELS